MTVCIEPKLTSVVESGFSSVLPHREEMKASGSVGLEHNFANYLGRAHAEFSSEEEKYKRKYLSLRRRCENIEDVNGKITNRLHSVKKTIRKLKRERKFLVSKLEGFGDNYCNVPIIVSLEDGPDRSGVGTQNSYSSVPPCLLSGITSDPSFDSSSLVTPSSLPEIKTPQQNTEYKESSQHNHSFTSSSIVQTNCHDS